MFCILYKNTFFWLWVSLKLYFYFSAGVCLGVKFKLRSHITLHISHYTIYRAWECLEFLFFFQFVIFFQLTFIYVFMHSCFLIIFTFSGIWILLNWRLVLQLGSYSGFLINVLYRFNIFFHLYTLFLIFGSKMLDIPPIWFIMYFSLWSLPLAFFTFSLFTCFFLVYLFFFALFALISFFFKYILLWLVNCFGPVPCHVSHLSSIHIHTLCHSIALPSPSISLCIPSLS